jgi:hypothetical protein
MKSAPLVALSLTLGIGISFALAQEKDPSVTTAKEMDLPATTSEKVETRAGGSKGYVELLGLLVGLLVVAGSVAALIIYRRPKASSFKAPPEPPAEKPKRPGPEHRKGALVQKSKERPTSEVPQIQPKVFVSYRREDSADVTGRIYDRLLQTFYGQNVFKDVDSIPLGADFRVHLDEMVARCDVFLVVIGKQWLQAVDSSGKRRLDDPADFVRIELESALKRGIPVIPMLVRGAVMPSEAQLPSTLKGMAYRNGIQVRADPDFHNDMNRLIAGLKAHWEKKREKAP